MENLKKSFGSIAKSKIDSKLKVNADKPLYKY